mmetsp:Transcript_91842/g.285666  ORF Transcript_91842/g.285666 Transcript_91842/m.285666 type:complete len:366 (+) Transcript_91842:90-1187(+)
MELPETQLQVTLERRPVGPPKEGEDLVLRRAVPLPQLKPGEALVRNLAMSLDPAMRPQMSIRTYVEPVPLGTVMRSTTVGEVVSDPSGRFRPGDLVQGPGGWQEYYAAKPRFLQPASVPPGMPVTSCLGLLGGTGLTAYFGLLRVGAPKAGETVLVSGAAGATGNAVAQIAKNVVGCRVIGIAGGKEKCRWLVQELGLDGAIDYKDVGAGEGLNKAIKELCPKGVDCYFDNVGGDMLNQALRRMKLHGRVVMCGAISGYNMLGGEDRRVDIKAQYAASIVSSRIRLQGFIVSDFAEEFPKAMEDLAQWLREGRLRNQETVVRGLENAGAAFRGLFEGLNTGKLLVQIAEPRLSGRAAAPGAAAKL